MKPLKWTVVSKGMCSTLRKFLKEDKNNIDNKYIIRTVMELFNDIGGN